MTRLHARALILGCCLAASLFARAETLSDADRWAACVPRQYWRSFDELSRCLATVPRAARDSDRPKNPSDLFKGRAVYRWITGHIRAADLDTQKLPARPAFLTLHGNYVNEGYSPQQTLTRGYTTCEGFALLFEALATEMDLKVEYISGIAGSKGNWGYHAWNAVRIDGQWEMIDATWGSKAYQRERWFRPLKKEFLRSHIPDDEYLEKSCYAGLGLQKRELSRLRRQMTGGWEPD